MGREWADRRGSSGRLVFYAIAALVIAGVVVYFVWLTPCNAMKQQQNMAKAQAYIDTHSGTFFKDVRNAGVIWQAYTGGTCGSLLVSGYVLDEKDSERIKATIDATAPGVEVQYRIEVADQTAWMEHVPQERRDEFGLPFKKDGSPGPLGDPAAPKDAGGKDK